VRRMKIYLWRIKGDQDQQGKTESWFGLAAASSMGELFWLIDESTDPFRVEVKLVTCGVGVCFKEIETMVCADDADYERSDLEITEGLFLEIEEDKGWEVIDWVKLGYPFTGENRNPRKLVTT